MSADNVVEAGLVFVLVEMVCEWPWATEFGYSFRLITRTQATDLAKQIGNADSPISGVVVLPDGLIETAQRIVEVNQ